MIRSRLVCVCRNVARLAFCVAAVLSLLIAPALLLASLFAWGGVATDYLANLALGLICSLIAWLFVAIFHLSREKLVVPVPERQTFLPQVRVLLDEMGYEVTAETLTTLAARPRFNAMLFGGTLRIAMQENRATLQGPKMSAEILRNRLRVVHHLFRIHSLLQEDRKITEPLLKRIELHLRCKPEQLPSVQQRVLDPLMESGEVTLDLHVLVQSENGLRESHLERHLLPWVKQNQIVCDIHKHHAKLFEPQRRARRKAAQEVPARQEALRRSL
jgi:hypothetical protein